MALARRPGKQAEEAAKSKPVTVVDEAMALRLIDKGGSAAVAEAKTSKAFAHPLKFPADGILWDRLEAARQVPAVKLPRNTWILQAIAEKLARDGN